MTIKNVLELSPGSVIELDKLAGEPAELLVNGKLIAKGEVIVENQKYGIRITKILSRIDRIKNLK